MGVFSCFTFSLLTFQQCCTFLSNAINSNILPPTPATCDHEEQKKVYRNWAPRPPWHHLHAHDLHPLSGPGQLLSHGRRVAQQDGPANWIPPTQQWPHHSRPYTYISPRGQPTPNLHPLITKWKHHSHFQLMDGKLGTHNAHSVIFFNHTLLSHACIESPRNTREHRGTWIIIGRTR